jgi:hypothetical protein
VKVEQHSVIVPCPNCENQIYLGYSLGAGERINCPICWAYLVITDLEAVELNWDFEEYDEDDWGLDAESTDE